jgi:hypothetical protein
MRTERSPPAMARSATCARASGKVTLRASHPAIASMATAATPMSTANTVSADVDRRRSSTADATSSAESRLSTSRSASIFAVVSERKRAGSTPKPPVRARSSAVRRMAAISSVKGPCIFSS